MTKFQIELPAEIAIVRGGGHVIVQTEQLTEPMVANLVSHGLVQKIGDAAAGATGEAGFKGQKLRELGKDEAAKVADVANGLMQKVLDQLYAGDWRVATRSDTDPLAVYIRAVVRANLSAESKATFDKIKGTTERNAWLADRYEALDESTAAKVKSAAEARKAIDDKAKAEASAVKVDVTL